MKIVHLTAPAPFGGLESVVAGLARDCVTRGHSVTIVLSLSAVAEMPSWAEELQEAGVKLEVLRLPGRAYLAERRAVRSLLRRALPDIVHSHGYRSDALHQGTVHALGLPLVSTAHGFASSGGIGRFYEWLQLRAWRRFDAVVAVSLPLRDVLAARGIPHARLQVIRNGVVGDVSYESREGARVHLGLPAAGLVFGWIGRLSEEKNPLLAVDALAELGEPNARLCVVGDGPLRLDVARRARQLGVGQQVVLVGARPAASRLLRAFDALVLSSRTEGTPMVLLEAAMAEVPIIATGVGGVPALVGSEATIVPSEDSRALARAMGSHIHDPGAGQRNAEALRRRLQQESSANDWVDAYVALYQRVIQGRRAAH